MNFNEVLNTAVSAIERPPTVPIGEYKAFVEKIPSIDTIADGRFDICDFQMHLTQALDTVDADELKAYGKINGVRQRLRFMFNRDPDEETNFKRSLYNLKRFLVDHLQIDDKGDDALKQMLNDAVNKACIVTIGLRVDKNNPEIMYSEITKTAPLD
jgi:hypothetical protein